MQGIERAIPGTGLGFVATQYGPLLADYLPYADTVKIPVSMPRVPACRDPFDVPFLAVAGRADFLVTGDQDLRALDGQIPCAVVTAEVF